MMLAIADAHRLAADALAVVGYTPCEAETIVDHLMDSELRGLSYGGLARALSIIERRLSHPTPPRPMTITDETPVSVSLDGGDQVGYLVADHATNLAIEKAKATGIAAVGARNTWYTGMFSYFLERVTQAGFTGMAAGSTWQRVAPHGGCEARLGTNPIAFGFPTASTPVIWDAGTAAMMVGEVDLARRTGARLPEGVAFDKDGRPTCDPDDAASGAWAVWGGHKGSGLNLSVHLLGMMCGAPAAPEGVRDCGFFLFVINPDLLTSGTDYRERASLFAAALRRTKPLDPNQPVRVPFERSAADRAARLAAGQVDVPDAVYRSLMRVLDGSRPS